MIEVADHLLLFSAKALQVAGEFVPLFDKAGDGVWAVMFVVLHAEERHENNDLPLRWLGVFAP